MVNGIGSAASGNNFFQRPFSQGSGIFSVSDANPRNLLQLDPIFQPPTEELREAEEQRNRNNPPRDPESNQSNQDQQFNSRPLAAEPRLGESLSRLAIQSEQDNLQGGSLIDVEGGEITFAANDREITVGESDEARIARNDDGSMTIRNETTDEEQTFQAGEQIQLEGEGNTTISGTTRETIGSGENQIRREVGRQLTFAAGEQLNITSEGGGALRRVDSEESIVINPSEPTSIAIAGNSDERFIFGNDQGVSLEFDAGQTGTLAQNDQGDVVITNEDTGESAVFSPNRELNTGGNATARLRGPGGDRLDFDGRDRGRFRSSEAGTLELGNLETRESIQVQPSEEPPRPERPLQLRTFDDPSLEQTARLQEELIRRPDEEARNAADEAQEENNDSPNSGEDPEQEFLQASSFTPEEDNFVAGQSILSENVSPSSLEEVDNAASLSSEPEEELPGSSSDPEAQDEEFPFNPIQEDQASGLARSFSENQQDTDALIGQQINFRA